MKWEWGGFPPHSCHVAPTSSYRSILADPQHRICENSDHCGKRHIDACFVLFYPLIAQQSEGFLVIRREACRAYGLSHAEMEKAHD